jgi:hypothetical protein
VITSCSCGTGCHWLVMWDVLTGKVFNRESAFGAINVGPYLEKGAEPPIYYDGEQFRVDSTLLIVDGCREQTCDCAKRYYSFTGRQFKLIFRQPVRMPDKCVGKT